MKRLFRWRKGHDVGPPLTPEELQRADQWMKSAFRRDTKRIADQTPRDLLDRCLRITRADEGRVSSRVWLSQQAWGWAAVIVLVALAAAVIMRTERPDDSVTSKKTVLVPPPASRQQPLLSRSEHSPTAQPLRGRASAPGQIAQDDSPPVISRKPHTIDSTRRTNALAQRNAARPDAHTPGNSAHGESDSEMTVQFGQAGGAVTEWDLESPNPGDAARGTALVSAGGAAPRSAASVSTVASNLVPNATYAVLIQFAGSSEPVLVDRATTDASGALHLSIDLTPERVDAIRHEIESGSNGSPGMGSGTGTNRDTTAGTSTTTGGSSSSAGTLILPSVIGVVVRSETGETALQPSTSLRPQ